MKDPLTILILICGVGLPLAAIAALIYLSSY